MYHGDSLVSMLLLVCSYHNNKFELVSLLLGFGRLLIFIHQKIDILILIESLDK